MTGYLVFTLAWAVIFFWMAYEVVYSVRCSKKRKRVEKGGFYDDFRKK